MNYVKGIAPILHATFHENGEIDTDSFKRQIAYLNKSNASAVTMFGINSEFYKLTDDERDQFFLAQIEACREVGLPAITSVTQHATYVACKQAQYYEANGADTLMLLPPFFLKPSAEELITHIEAVLKSVSIPVIIQYAPEQTGVPIPPESLVRLFDNYENAKQFKIECNPPGPYISRLLALTNNQCSVLVGNTGFTLIESLERGANGAMPGSTFTAVYAKVYELYVSGQFDEAFELHKKIVCMYHLIRQSIHWPLHYEKEIMKERGIIESDFCRYPAFVPPDPVVEKLFRKHYEGLKHMLPEL